jgi:PAS domain-containing protein
MCYLLAVLAELLAVGAVAGLVQAFPTFAYPGIIPLLTIASVALVWGAAPSLAATAVGAVGLDLLVLRPRFVWHLDSLDDVVDVGLFVVVGVVIAAGASRTERARRTAQDLAEQLDAVIDAMADGVYLCDPAGRIQKTNRALRRLLAMDDQAAASSRPLHVHAALFIPRDTEGRLLPHEKWPVVRVLKGETLTGAQAVDMRIRTLDGRELELNTSGAPMRDVDGRLTGSVLVARDVTERRQLERRAHQALSGVLAMAEALVLGPSETTGVDADTPGAATRVARHVAELTRSVLGCARIGIVAVEEETGVIHPVAAAGLSPVQDQQWRKGLEKTPLHEYLGDQGTEAYVLVRDQGPGLTMEQQTHIWDRYRRVQGVAVQDKTPGASASLGLGLYISRTIIEKHGGRVGVESRPGTGSTFWFALPLSQ